MSLWNNTTPPVLYPDAVATPAGWADPVTGELLVTVTGLSTFKGTDTELNSVRIVGKKLIFADGDYIVLEADFSQAVTVSGTPTIAATINSNSRTFTYFVDNTNLKSDGVTIANGTGTNKIRFRYQVATSETATPVQISFTSPISGTFTNVDSAAGVNAAGTAVTTSGVTSIAVTAPGSGYTSAPTVVFTGGTPTRTAAATAVLDQQVATVVVSAGGSGYTSAPTVGFTGGGGSSATATAVLSSTGSVKSITVGGSGTSYTNGDTVLIAGGGGMGATGTLVTSSGNVTSVTITAGGSGFTSAPAVTITSGSGSGNTFTAVVGKSVASVTVTAGGTGFTSAPSVGFSSGGGSGAAATATLSNLQTVASITVTDPGSGYGGTPTVSFTGTGTSATATATNTTVVDSVTMTVAGTAYWLPPTVGFSGGGGSAAAGTATVDRGTVTGVTMTNHGAGYSSAPTVAFTATAEAPTSNNFTTAGISTGFSVDGVHPTISSVTCTGESSTNNFVTNDLVTLTLTGSKTLYVNTHGGTPTIALTVGSNPRNAVYLQGTGTNTLQFTYEIVAGDSATGTNFSVSSPVVLNSGTITDYQGNPLTLTFTAPTTTSVVVNQIITPAFTSAALTGFNSGVAFVTSNTVTVTLTANEDATVTTTFGTPFIEVFIGNVTRFANYASGSGTTSLVFTYVVTSADSALAGNFSVGSTVISNGGSIKNGSAYFPGEFTAPAASTVTVN